MERDEVTAVLEHTPGTAGAGEVLRATRELHLAAACLPLDAAVEAADPDDPTPICAVVDGAEVERARGAALKGCREIEVLVDDTLLPRTGELRTTLATAALAGLPLKVGCYQQLDEDGWETLVDAAAAAGAAQVVTTVPPSGEIGEHVEALTRIADGRVGIKVTGIRTYHELADALAAGAARVGTPDPKDLLVRVDASQHLHSSRAEI